MRPAVLLGPDAGVAVIFAYYVCLGCLGFAPLTRMGCYDFMFPLGPLHGSAVEPRVFTIIVLGLLDLLMQLASHCSTRHSARVADLFKFCNASLLPSPPNGPEHLRSNSHFSILSC